MIMKLGFTLYNFHSVIDSLEDLDNVLAKLENMGVDTVQVSGIGYLNNYDVAKLCKKHGMEVCLTHLSFDRIVNDTDAVIEEHKALGCKNVGIGWIEENTAARTASRSSLRSLPLLSKSFMRQA